MEYYTSRTQSGQRVFYYFVFCGLLVFPALSTDGAETYVEELPDASMVKLEALIAICQDGGQPAIAARWPRNMRINGMIVCTDAAMPHLAAFPELKLLDLSDSDVTDEGMLVLRYLNALERLRLDNTKISDAALIQIARCRHLRELSLAGCTGVTPHGIRHLARLELLKKLDLSRVPLGEGSLSEIERMPKLKDLCLDQTGVTDEVVGSLLRCRRLERLRLADAQLTDAGASQLDGLPLLRILALSGPHITDRTLKALVDAPSLELVEAWKAGVSAESVRQFMCSSGAHFIYSDPLRVSRISNKGYLEENADGIEQFVPRKRYREMLRPLGRKDASLDDVQPSDSSGEQDL